MAQGLNLGNVMAKLSRFNQKSSQNTSRQASGFQRWVGVVYLFIFLTVLSIVLFFGQHWVMNTVRAQRLATLTQLNEDIAQAEKNVSTRAAALKLNQGVIATEDIVKSGHDYQFVLWNGVPALRVRSGLIQLLSLKDWIVQPLPEDLSEMSVMRAGLRFNLRDYKNEQIDQCYLEVSMHVQNDTHYHYQRVDQGC